MQQAADIRDAVSPDEILFVVDAMIGQDAVNTAEAFRDGVGFDGVVLSKLDGDARGGAALSIAHVTGKQIMFASNGEKLDDFDAFHPDRMASRILGMGDMLTLIEKAEQTFSQEEAEKMASKLASKKGPRTSRSTTSWPRWSRSARWAPSPSCSACCPAWARSRTRSTTSTSATSTAPPRSSSR